MPVQAVYRDERIVKTGIAFPRDILMKFDDVARRMGIPNRSKAVVEAAMKFISDNMWVYSSGIVVGALNIMYKDSDKSIQMKLLEIRNRFPYNINAMVKIALDDDRLMDIWLVRGDVKSIKRLIESIERLNGVYILRSIVPL